jgi:hypothetical protein
MFNYPGEWTETFQARNDAEEKIENNVANVCCGGKAGW